MQAWGQLSTTQAGSKGKLLSPDRDMTERWKQESKRYFFYLEWDFDLPRALVMADEVDRLLWTMGFIFCKTKRHSN